MGACDGAIFPIPDWHGVISPHWGVANLIGGSDLFAACGSPVRSMVAGTVVSAGFDPTGGNNVLIQGANGLLYYFAHLLNTPLVQAGQSVGQGAPLGSVGQTGNAQGTGCHLHIGIGPTIHHNQQAVDPMGGLGEGFDAIGCLRAALSNLLSPGDPGAVVNPVAPGIPNAGPQPNQPSEPCLPGTGDRGIPCIPRPGILPHPGDIPNPLDTIKSVGELIGKLFDPNTWERFGIGIIGVMLVIIGAGVLVWESGGRDIVVQTVKA